MKITNKKSLAQTQEVTLSEIDCREAIAYWLKKEHGLEAGRKDVNFESTYDNDWGEVVFNGATVWTFKFITEQCSNPLTEQDTNNQSVDAPSSKF